MSDERYCDMCDSYTDHPLPACPGKPASERVDIRPQSRQKLNEMNIRYTDILDSIDYALAGNSAAEIIDRILDLRNRVRQPETMTVEHGSIWEHGESRVKYVVEKIGGDGKRVIIGLESLLDETETLRIPLDELFSEFSQIDPDL